MISVIIVTYNRKVLLGQCLESLLGQDVQQYDEVVVVDNASTDGTYGFIKNLFKDRVKIIRSVCRIDLALCKELGVQSAVGEVIAFTDDDCIVPSGWLDKIRASIKVYDVVGGVVLPVKSVRFPGWWRPSLEWVLGLNADPGQHFLPVGSNIAFRREAFKTLGVPLGTPFLGPYGEDNARLRASLRAGFKLGINKDMIVYHQITRERLTFSYFMSRSYREGQCLARREPAFPVFLSMMLAFCTNPLRFLITWDINRLCRMRVALGYMVTYFKDKALGLA